MLTTEQVRNRTKDVTRRLGWLDLKPGERLQGCVKCMGRRKGEPLEKLAVIEVVNARREMLGALTRHMETGALTLVKEGSYLMSEAQDECRREGFPHFTPAQFVEMFCQSHKGCTQHKTITRIEFKYV